MKDMHAPGYHQMMHEHKTRVPGLAFDAINLKKDHIYAEMESLKPSMDRKPTAAMGPYGSGHADRRKMAMGMAQGHSMERAEERKLERSPEYNFQRINGKSTKG